MSPWVGRLLRPVWRNYVERANTRLSPFSSLSNTQSTSRDNTTHDFPLSSRDRTAGGPPHERRTNLKFDTAQATDAKEVGLKLERWTSLLRRSSCRFYNVLESAPTSDCFGRSIGCLIFSLVNDRLWHRTKAQLSNSKSGPSLLQPVDTARSPLEFLSRPSTQMTRQLDTPLSVSIACSVADS